MRISATDSKPSCQPYNSLVYLTLLFLICIIAYWPVSFYIFSLKNDALNYFLPVRHLVSESYHNNILPLWTPYLNLGYPLHGDMQSGVWNPFVQLFSWISPYNLYMLHLETLLYIFLSGVGMFFLLKYFKVHPYANLLASVAFMLCGFNSDSCQFLNWIAGTAFFPFVFLFYYKCLHEQSIRNGIYTGIFLFFLFTCAYPADFILALYIILAMLIWQLRGSFRNKEPGFLRKIIIPHLWLIIIFLLLASPAILSYYQSLPLTERGTGASYTDVMSNSLHPALLSSFTTPLAIWKMPGVNITDPLERNSYLGIIGFILLVISFRVKSKNKLASFSKWSVLIFLLFSLGEIGGLRVLSYYILPLLDTFRHPANAKMFTLFFSSILIGLVYHSILTGEVKTKYLKTGLWITFSALLIIFAFSLFKGFSFFSFMALAQLFNSTTNHSFAIQIKTQLEKISFADLVLITTLIQLPFLFLANRYLIVRPHPRKLVVLSLINCVLFTMLFQPFTVVKSQRAHLIQKKIDNLSVKGYPAPDVDKTLEENSINNEKYFADIGCQNLYNKIIGRSDYRITPSNLLSQNEFWVNEAFRKKILKNKLVYQKTLLSTSTNNIEGEQITQVDSVSFQFIKFEPNNIEFLADHKKEEEVVLMQNYYPNWRLYIDGKPAAIKKVDTTFMGFTLPEGNHVITFKYEAKAIRFAFAISLAVLGTLFLYTIISFFSKKTFYNKPLSKILK